MEYMHMTEEDYKLKHTLTGSIIQPEEIAETVNFLVLSPNITGQTIIIDSGLSLMGDLRA